MAARDRDPSGFRQANKLWVVVGVPARATADGWMVPSCATHDMLAGVLQVFGQYGGIPRTAV